MKKSALLLTALLATGHLSAQEELGMKTSNYAPSNSILLNPATMVNSKAFIDVNWVGASAFARNNFAYLPKSQFYAPKDLPRLNFPDLPGYNTSRNKLKGYADLAVQGPSATFQVGRHAFGLQTSVRNITMAKKIPGYLGRVLADGAEVTDSDLREYKDRNIRMKSMTWGEIGLSYGTIVKNVGRDMWTVGGTVKRLYGLHHAAAILERVDIVTSANNQVQINDIQGKYATSDFNFRAGRGWSTDLGVNYAKMLEDVTRYQPHRKRFDCDCVDYKYRFGASIVDLGYIRFKNNAVAREFDRNTQVTDIDSISTGDDLSQVSPENGTFTEKTRYTALMPTAISAQFDYNFENNFRVNATLVQGAYLPRNYGPERASNLSVTPRYETQWFEAALPLSLQGYTKPQVGLAFRLAYLWIGTDNLLPMVVRSDVYSADIYFALKYTLFNNPTCKDKRKGLPSLRNMKYGKPKRGKKEKCPGPAGS